MPSVDGYLDMLLVRERSEPYTLRGNTIENRRYFCWRASVASETVLGVDNAKSGICYSAE